MILLGPQRFHPTVAAALGDLGMRRSAAVITAGWQEREAEVDELREHVGIELVNLELYRRHERVVGEDIELFEALRRRQDRLRELQRLYRMRLDRYLEALRAIPETADDPEMLAPEYDDALAAVRALDRHHLRRVDEIHREFEEQWRPAERPAVMRHRQEIARILERVDGLAIAGGHVLALLNRLQLFDLRERLSTMPIVAWSAGAMVLTEQIVVFHDSPPQGAGNAELIGSGLGLAPGIVALPHADRRLKLGDPGRVGVFARRFAPALSVALVGGARLELHESKWSGHGATQVLAPSGTLRVLGAA